MNAIRIKVNSVCIVPTFVLFIKEVLISTHKQLVHSVSCLVRFFIAFSYNRVTINTKKPFKFSFRLDLCERIKFFKRQQRREHNCYSIYDTLTTTMNILWCHDSFLMHPFTVFNDSSLTHDYGISYLFFCERILTKEIHFVKAKHGICIFERKLLYEWDDNLFK